MLSTRLAIATVALTLVSTLSAQRFHDLTHLSATADVATPASIGVGDIHCYNFGDNTLRVVHPSYPPNLSGLLAYDGTNHTDGGRPMQIIRQPRVRGAQPILHSNSHGNLDKHVPHPDYRATTILGAKGKLIASYLAVSYDPIIGNLKKGFGAHVGHTKFETEVPLQSGKVRIPKGSYRLNMRRGKDKHTWRAVLIPARLYQLTDAETIAALAKKGVKRLALPSSTFAGNYRKHLCISWLNYGFVTKGPGNLEAAGGVEAEFRLAYGNIRMSFAITEVVGKKRPLNKNKVDGKTDGDK